MNILIPHQWLLEHLETKATTDQISKALSLTGSTVESVTDVLGEPVYDIEITTNRVDSASIRGIAREAATSLPEFDIPAKLKPLKANTDEIKEQVKNLPQVDLEIVNDPKLCKRLMGITLEVKVKESPDWLKKRLEQVGQRPLNNLIDSTNYIMWELGHPTHIFDYDKFTQKKLLVREAKEGETVTTLDKKIYTTVGGEVIFDDGTGTIIDMPGLMGTDNTIVDSNTKRVLFFIDSVFADKIRFASMTHGIRTQAAILNEKHVDPGLGMDAMVSGIDLLIQIADAKPTSNIFDDWPVKTDTKTINLENSLLEKYLGIEISTERVTRILQSLGFQVNVTNEPETTYSVIPPSYRSDDIQISQDVIEEVARIYGYHNLPSKLLDTKIPDITTNLNHQLEQTIRVSLADWGATEVYTYSLVSQDLANQSGYDLSTHLKVSNTLTEDLEYLRKSLIPSHLQVFNNNKAQHNWTIFELANTYLAKQATLPEEVMELVISNNHSFDEIKHLVDLLAEKLRLPDYHIAINPNLLSPEYLTQVSGIIMSGEVVLGFLGQTSLGIFAASLKLSELEKQTRSHPTYQPLATTSPIIEDMTFTLADNTPVGAVIDTVKQMSSLIDSVDLKDQYKQNFTFTISYLNRDQQLRVEDIKSLRDEIVNLLKDKFSASLVG